MFSLKKPQKVAKSRKSLAKNSALAVVQNTRNISFTRVN